MSTFDESSPLPDAKIETGPLGNPDNPFSMYYGKLIHQVCTTCVEFACINMQYALLVEGVHPNCFVGLILGGGACEWGLSNIFTES